MSEWTNGGRTAEDKKFENLRRNVKLHKDPKKNNNDKTFKDAEENSGLHLQPS